MRTDSYKMNFESIINRNLGQYGGLAEAPGAQPAPKIPQGFGLECTLPVWDNFYTLFCVFA